MAYALPTKPVVQRPAQVLARFALGVAVFGFLALAVLVLVGSFADGEVDLATMAGMAVVLLVAGLPLPGIGALVLIRDRRWFRIVSLLLVPGLLVFSLFTLMLGVGYTYLLSAILLMSACASGFSLKRESRAVRS
jgi:hypothetical protein